MESPKVQQENSEELILAKALVQEIRQALIDGYEEAGISGLCDEGRFEAALGVLETLPLEEIVAKALHKRTES